eukprot:703055-Prorocentrum_minimum.AAC.2
MDRRLSAVMVAVRFFFAWSSFLMSLQISCTIISDCSALPASTVAGRGSAEVQWSHSRGAAFGARAPCEVGVEVGGGLCDQLQRVVSPDGRRIVLSTGFQVLEAAWHERVTS